MENRTEQNRTEHFIIGGHHCTVECAAKLYYSYFDSFDKKDLIDELLRSDYYSICVDRLTAPQQKFSQAIDKTLEMIADKDEKMLVVDKQNIANMLLLETFSEMHQVQDKLNYFRRKYQQDFESFSKQIENENEDFERFDDYMEWKAYTKMFYNISQKIEDLKHGNFQIA